MPQVSVGYLIALRTSLEDLTLEARIRADTPAYPENMRSYYTGYADAMEAVQANLSEIIRMAKDDE